MIAKMACIIIIFYLCSSTVWAEPAGGGNSNPPAAGKGSSSGQGDSISTATPPPLAANAAGSNGQKNSETGILTDLLKLRDPFKKPDDAFKTDEPKTDLERYGVDQFKLIGVSTGPTRLRALVAAPDGKTYFVAEKIKIGTRGGIVRKITPDSIQVRERMMNVVGQEENIDSEIRLPAESRVKETSTAEQILRMEGITGPGNLGGAGAQNMGNMGAPAFIGNQGLPSNAQLGGGTPAGSRPEAPVAAAVGAAQPGAPKVSGTGSANGAADGAGGGLPWLNADAQKGGSHGQTPGGGGKP